MRQHLLNCNFCFHWSFYCKFGNSTDISSRPNFGFHHLNRAYKNLVSYGLVLTDFCINQDDTLKGNLASADVATKDNLKNLVKVGKELLKRTVTKLDLDTGRYEPIENGGTNEEKLKRYLIPLSHKNSSISIFIQSKKC